MARVVSARVRNWGKDRAAVTVAAFGSEDEDEGWWKRYDSKPLEKAKEPRGRAESERRRRGCDGRPLVGLLLGEKDEGGDRDN